ncbi:MAG: hypothetical protein U0638_05840 [Phycisphaerales bacterium]
MNTLTTSSYANRTSTKQLLSVVGLVMALSAASANAQSFTYINAPSKNYNESRSNTAARSIVFVHGKRNDGRPYLGLWDVKSNEILENTSPDMDFAESVEAYAFAQSRSSGDPVKGVGVGVVRKPRPIAFYWNTNENGEGNTHLLNDMGVGASWATSVGASGQVIGGALYGSHDGGPESPRAVVWEHEFPSLLPLPAGTHASEVTGISSDGQVRVGTTSSQYSSRPQGKAINEKGVQFQGIVWTPNGMSVVSPSVAGSEALSIGLNGIGPDDDACFATISTTRSNAKGGMYRPSTNTFTLLDGGDINHDGMIDMMDDHDSAVCAISLDSSIAGGSITVAGIETAMVWVNSASGYQPVDAASYIHIGGTGNDGVRLTRVTGISPDGFELSGEGIAPDGYATVWHATVPAPGAASLALLGGLAALRRRR